MEIHWLHSGSRIRQSSVILCKSSRKNCFRLKNFRTVLQWTTGPTYSYPISSSKRIKWKFKKQFIKTRHKEYHKQEWLKWCSFCKLLLLSETFSDPSCLIMLTSNLATSIRSLLFLCSKSSRKETWLNFYTLTHQMDNSSTGSMIHSRE